VIPPNVPRETMFQTLLDGFTWNIVLT